jgi:hypothetical protein
MPTYMNEQSVAANTTVANFLAGSAFEFARGPGVMSAGVTAAATGIIENIQSGPDIVAEAFAVPIATRYPIIPDEMYFTQGLRGGERVVFRGQNTTGGALVHRTVVQFSFQG